MTDWLGLGAPAQTLTFVQVALRAVIVCLATLVLVRIAHRRFLAQLSTFDAIVIFLLASTLARAVNGTSSFWPSIGGGAVIVLMHRMLAAVAVRSTRLGAWIKGEPDVLVRDGTLFEERLGAHGLSHEDFLEQARLNGGVDRASAIALAVLERNGQISIVRRPASGAAADQSAMLPSALSGESPPIPANGRT